MSDHDDYDDYDDGFFACPRCQGFGEVSCHCGGDLCVCENHGDAPCPTCYGEGEVSEARYDQYMAAERENARLMAEAWAKIEADKESKR